VADDGDVVTRGTTERTTVGGLVLDVGENGTFGDGSEGEDVADGKSGVLSGVDELFPMSATIAPPANSFVQTDLASVHALVSDEGLGLVLEPVGLRDASEMRLANIGLEEFRTLRKVTLARGAPRPLSWTISFTTPRMYPLRSACVPISPLCHGVVSQFRDVRGGGRT
jgi:hypothetical protein